MGLTVKCHHWPSGVPRKIHHKKKESLGEQNSQRNRGSEAHHLAKA